MSNNSLFVISNNGTVVDPCLECGQTVRPRQEAIQCENCSFWQHRTCNTNITRECYRRAVRGEEELQWQCVSCLNNFQLESDELPLFESTRYSTFSTGEGDYPLPNEDVSVLNSSISHPNTSFVHHSIIAFHPDQTNDHNSSTLNGSLDDSAETNLPTVSNIDTNQYPDFSIPENIQESSLDLSFLHTSNQNSQIECIPDFEVITKSSQKGKDVLVEKVGYTYVINIRRNMVNYWRYSVRNKSVTCPARIIQRGSMFTRGPNDHNHQANPGVNLKTKLRVNILNKAKSDIFVPAAEIVENALVPYTTCPGLPSLANLSRAANRARQSIRPEDPVDLEFEINTEYIPENSLRGDIKVDDRRHLVFATNHMLNILSRAKIWYLDGNVEISLWRAFPKVYPGVKLQGCSFHWTQAVWRKIQLLGLQQQYMSDISTHDFCRKLMALPFLPAEHIEHAFRNLVEHVSSGTELELATYIDTTWISGNWHPNDWCIFNQAVRTKTMLKDGICESIVGPVEVNCSFMY